jgi:lipid-binding SYLF domain-containing protein
LTAGVVVTATLLAAGAALAVDKKELDAKVEQAVQTFRKENPNSADALSKASGVLICPVIRKAGLGVGIERGVCALRVANKTDGYWRVTGASWGLIAGLQSYGMLLVFRNPETLEKFRQTSREWEVGVDAGVTVAKQGAGGQLDLNTVQGDQVAFIFAEKGLLADLSIQGSRFKKIPDSFTDAEALVKVVATAKSGQVEVALTRWSTETERQAYAAAFRDQGPEAARKMIQNGIACG